MKVWFLSVVETHTFLKQEEINAMINDVEKAIKDVDKKGRPHLIIYTKDIKAAIYHHFFTFLI